MDALPSGGLYQRRDDTVGLEPAVRAGAETDLPHDHHLTQGLLRVIVRGRNAGDAQKGEEVFLLRADEECSQGLGRFEGERPLTDPLQFAHEPLFDVRRIRPEDLV